MGPEPKGNLAGAFGALNMLCARHAKNTSFAWTTPIWTYRFPPQFKMSRSSALFGDSTTFLKRKHSGNRAFDDILEGLLNHFGLTTPIRFVDHVVVGATLEGIEQDILKCRASPAPFGRRLPRSRSLGASLACRTTCALLWSGNEPKVRREIITNARECGGPDSVPHGLDDNCCDRRGLTRAARPNPGNYFPPTPAAIGPTLLRRHEIFDRKTNAHMRAFWEYFLGTCRQIRRPTHGHMFYTSCRCLQTLTKIDQMCATLGHESAIFVRI